MFAVSFDANEMTNYKVRWKVVVVSRETDLSLRYCFLQSFFDHVSIKSKTEREDILLITESELLQTEPFIFIFTS